MSYMCVYVPNGSTAFNAAWRVDSSRTLREAATKAVEYARNLSMLSGYHVTIRHILTHERTLNAMANGAPGSSYREAQYTAHYAEQVGRESFVKPVNGSALHAALSS